MAAAFVFASLLFCSAILRRLDRIGLEVNWVLDPRPDIDIAVEREPCSKVSDPHNL